MIDKDKLEIVIEGAFYSNVNQYCPHCESPIKYEDYGDPVGAITEAINKLLEGS